MCDPITVGIGTALGASAGSAAAVGSLALGLGASTALSVYQGEKARKSQKQAADRARTEADQTFNKANPKRPNPLGMADANAQTMSSGAGSTMLTGAAGVAPAGLQLGRTTLLGG